MGAYLVQAVPVILELPPNLTLLLTSQCEQRVRTNATHTAANTAADHAKNSNADANPNPNLEDLVAILIDATAYKTPDLVRSPSV